MDMILFEVFLKSIVLDSTTTDITTALFILQIMSLYYLILWNQVDILQKHLKRIMLHMRNTNGQQACLRYMLSHRIGEYGWQLYNRHANRLSACGPRQTVQRSNCAACLLNLPQYAAFGETVCKASWGSVRYRIRKQGIMLPGIGIAICYAFFI